MPSNPLSSCITTVQHKVPNVGAVVPKWLILANGKRRNPNEPWSDRIRTQNGAEHGYPDSIAGFCLDLHSLLCITYQQMDFHAHLVSLIARLNLSALVSCV